MIKLIYNGIERCDIVYYLSLIMSLKSTRVVVNDISKTKDLYHALVRETGDGYREFKNIIFTAGDPKSLPLGPDDIYIEYRGERILNEPTLAALTDDDITYHLIMSGYTERGIALAKETIPEGNPMYIMRDFSGSMKDKEYAGALGLKLEHIAGHIALDVKDYDLYQTFTRNGKQKFTNASPDMLAALTYITTTTLHLKEKDTRKLFKKANRLKEGRR